MPAWTISIGGTDRKYKKVNLDRKVRMDSPPEFTAVIEYGDDIDFNDEVVIQRDGKTEWKGFIEDMEIDWDENGRYLNIGGRDITLLIWRKYVENFTNMIKGTGGFFGNVSASELMKFLLRTPRSDLPISVDGTSVYPYNKEGWGIDVSRFHDLDAKRTAYGDINWTILRRRGLGWRNSGDPYAVITKDVDNVVNCSWEEFGSPPYLNDIDNVNYIKSHVNVNDSADFSFADISGASAIYGCKLVIYWKPDATWWSWLQSDCEVQIWVASLGGWNTIGHFGGKGSVFSNPWRTIEFDLFYILNTISDINAAKVRFVERSSNLSTYITYTGLEIGYVGNGTMTTDDWVQLSFEDETIMGIYVESRNSKEMYPRDYKITCVGNAEDFSDYEPEVDPNNHISLSGDSKTLTFDSYQDETAYFYKDYGVSPLGDFDETFSFEVDTSLPHPYAYIPWCLANNLEDYKILINTAGHYFTAIEVKDENGLLTIRATLKDSGGLAHSSYYDIEHSSISIPKRYFVKVTRIATALRYQVFDNPDMRTEDLVFDYTFTSDGTTFEYRYQAITYNGYEWGEVYLNNMDTFAAGGEQVTNDDFETGTFTGWNGAFVSISTTSPHTGTYCCKLDVMALLYTDPYMSIQKDNVTSSSLWHNSPLGSTFLVKLIYTDSTYTDISVVGTGSWTEQDLLSHWTSGKNLRTIEVGLNSDSMYIDDVSVYAENKWSTSGGTATRSTDTSNEREGTGCQKITGTADNQKFYFEREFSDALKAKVDGWVRLPAPYSESYSKLDDTYHVDDWEYDTQLNWTGAGTQPWLADNDSVNYISASAIDPSIQGTTLIKYFAIVPLGYDSFTFNSGFPELHVVARKLSGISGRCGTFLLNIHYYVDGVQLDSSPINVWFSADDDSWHDHSESTDTSALLNTLYKFKNVKIGIELVSVLDGSGNPITVSGYGSCDITQVYFEVDGTGYYGSIQLMKLYNKDASWSPDPDPDPATCVAAVSAKMDSSINDGAWRFYIEGYSFVGGLYYNLGTEAISNNTWYLLRLYATVGSGTAGEFHLYKVTGNSSPYHGQDGTEVLECEVMGIDNSSQITINMYDFEVEYGPYNGNGSDTYLDWTAIYTEGSTHSLGYVYAGYGPDIVLVNVTNNVYKDIIHSWQPRTMNNLKISITEDDANHGWEITQIYLYKTDDLKYRVVSDGLSQTEIKITLSSGGYTPCVNEDIGRQVFVTNLGATIGPLVSYDNDLREWRVNSSISIPLEALFNVNIDSGIGVGVLAVDSVSCYSGGPYITIGAELTPSFEYSVPLEPMNIAKNRLFDVLWDLCVAINDSYMPYEWWVDYDADNTFHIGSRRGYDKSSTVSFVTGINMEGVKYPKSSRDCYQRCQVVGSGEGNTQDNTSSFWESDEDAMDIVHGFIEDIVAQKQIVNPKLANSYAKVKLKLDASPTRKNAISCVLSKDTYETFDYTDPSDTTTYNVGDDVTITDLFTNLDGSFRIYNIAKAIDNMGEHITLIIQAPHLDIKNIWKQVWKELKSLGIVGTIAQDWAGEGTQSSQVAADKVSTLFSVTAKNEEVNTEPSSSPKWWFTGYPTAHTAPNGADWNAADNNLVIYGGTGGIGDIEVEARYEPITGSPDSSVNPILIEVDIPMNKEPNFTGEFKIWEPDIVQSPSDWSAWQNNDFVEFGIYDTYTDTGFKFRVKKESGQFLIYAVYVINGVEQEAKKICSLLSSTSISNSFKYKVEIITDYSSPINTVTFNVYDEVADSTNPISVVFIKIQDVTVRPIYIHAYGDGSSVNKRCIMHFYNLKCERKVMP